MEIHLAQQTQAFLFAAILGMLLGLLYDLLRCVKAVFGGKKTLGAVLDLLFCLAGLLSFFVFVLLYCAGSLRSYAFLGVLLGAMLYFTGLSGLVMGMLLPAARGLRWTGAKLSRAARRGTRTTLHFIGRSFTYDRKPDVRERPRPPARTAQKRKKAAKTQENIDICEM